jgi:hypothetical protein
MGSPLVAATPATYSETMKFAALDNDELADVWYALAGAEIRHPGCFTAMLEASHEELLKRLGSGLASFVDGRFAKLRSKDAAEDLSATKAASDSSCEDGVDTTPRR